MSETRKLAAILVADVVGFSRLAGADEVKRTGDGSIIEFRSVVDALRCAIEVQNVLIERNAEVSEDRRIQFRIGIHVGDVGRGSGRRSHGRRREYRRSPEGMTRSGP